MAPDKVVVPVPAWVKVPVPAKMADTVAALPVVLLNVKLLPVSTPVVPVMLPPVVPMLTAPKVWL